MIWPSDRFRIPSLQLTFRNQTTFSTALKMAPDDSEHAHLYHSHHKPLIK
jgi:hypothetical protein